MRTYSLEEFSKLTGLSKETIRGYDNLLQPLRTPGGHRRYTDDHFAKLYKLKLLDDKPQIEALVYTRVSTKQQMKDLERQLDLCLSYCSAKGWQVDEIIRDVGSSVNFNREGLIKLLKLILSKRPKYVVVATGDRLARIGFDLIKNLIQLTGSNLVVVVDDLNADTYDNEKLVLEELVHIIQLYAMKLYGMRSYKKIKQCIDKEFNNEASESDKT